jgi:hypothetical protein
MTIVPRRWLALVASIVTVAGGMTAATAQPASAYSTDTVCLTNANNYCVGISHEAAVWIADALPEIVAIILMYINKDNDGDNEDELVDSSTGQCLTDTGLSPGVDARWGPCGANGTVWIWVPHSDGYYLYSRYSVDDHKSMVLTVDPLSNDAPMYVDIGANPGSAYWQTFSYY